MSHQEDRIQEADVVNLKDLSDKELVTFTLMFAEECFLRMNEPEHARKGAMNIFWTLLSAGDHLSPSTERSPSDDPRP
jgi:hypothetical protein